MSVGPAFSFGVRAKNIARPLLDYVDPSRQLRSPQRLLRRLRYPVMAAEKGNDLIRQALASGGPLLVGRVGASEMKIVLHNRQHRAQENKRYPAAIAREIFVNSGVHPNDDAALDDFSQVYEDAMRQIDIFCTWHSQGEDALIRAHPSTATTLEALEPFQFQTPWSFALKGKKALVISPFVDSIAAQVARLEQVWGRDLFPDVAFHYLRFPLSQALNPAILRPRPWPDIVAEFSAQIDRLDFDVGLVGGGAATLPLAAHMKAGGRAGVALGGALQLLFGLMGRRWERDPRINRFFNEHWRRPSESETPPLFRTNESGAYW